MSKSHGALLGGVLVLAAFVAGLVFFYLERPDRSGPIVTEAEGELSDTQKQEVRETVRAYLLENPDVIVEALEILQTRRQQAEQQRQRGVLAANADRIVDERRDPVIGNPDGSVTIVEFFDYQCPYCKRMAQDMFDLAAEDPDLRIVFKEFPVFGTESILAARAALAAAKQGKYREFHLAVMNLRGAPSETAVFRLADSLGLDLDRLRNDMQSQDIEDTIQANYRLAQEIGVRGTPAFVVGNELIPGAMSLDAMRDLIARTREES
ncbi:MAG: DsbA family protein [Alphaproteobacteria bacterium]|nr:DsbA family protein [Alphaproteobacteria bacterium]